MTSSEELLLDQWPDAVEIRHVGKCDICHHDTLLTFRLPHHGRDIDNRGLEFCGYFCPQCNFSNAGRRVYITE